MPPPAVVSRAAQQTVQHAFEELRDTITPNDFNNSKKKTLQDVISEAKKIENELAARKALRNLKRFAPLFQGMEHYAKAMDVVCNGTPYLPWIWAPITLILRVAAEYMEAFEQIIKGYAKIGECLKRFTVLSSTFKGNAGFQETLAAFYADILEFHKHAYKFVHRGGWKLLFVTSWHRFQRQFGHILEDMKRHEDLIDKEANAHHIEEMRAWREESAKKFEQAENEQSAKQYESIISWLKVDEADQINLLDTLYREIEKYDGTCSWVLENEKMKTFLKDGTTDTPALWIQGTAGTGKSVLSASMVKSMDAAGSVVLTHFCSHAYPSSTRYETILRSLLHQLIRKDQDLAAHVHDSCVVGKKSPNQSTLAGLLDTLLSSVSKGPQQPACIWVVIDGVDECEGSVQNAIFSLVKRITRRSTASDNIFCKVLLSCRYSEAAAAKLGKAHGYISLTEEKEQVGSAIRQYAALRLAAMRENFGSLNVLEEDIKEIGDSVTKKSDGMFLYARLVLDYLASNVFLKHEEIKKAVNDLPERLSEFYSQILSQILVHVNATSENRIKCALGWIAFSKRPLKKIELLSAISFSEGDASVENIAPPFVLNLCAALIDENPNSTISFIHVSVKEFLQSSSCSSTCNLVLVERDCLIQHGIATTTCLLAGSRAFQDGSRAFQDGSHNEEVQVSVLKGLHALHIYSTRYWAEYLLSLLQAVDEFSASTSALFTLACELAKTLEQASAETRDDGEGPSKPADERIPNIQSPLLQRVINMSLVARSTDQLELIVRGMEENNMSVDGANILPIPPPLDGVSIILQRYQSILRHLLSLPDHPRLRIDELDTFKKLFRGSAYTCRLTNCPRAMHGFERQPQCHEHELAHVRRLQCTVFGCQYPAFVSARSLKSHIKRHHSQPAPPGPHKPLRRVNNLPIRNSDSSSRRENPEGLTSPDVASDQPGAVSEAQRGGQSPLTEEEERYLDLATRLSLGNLKGEALKEHQRTGQPPPIGNPYHVYVPKELQYVFKELQEVWVLNTWQRGEAEIEL
ncbi:kinesin light chain, partial [Apiospora arundinis]